MAKKSVRLTVWYNGNQRTKKFYDKDEACCWVLKKYWMPVHPIVGKRMGITPLHRGDGHYAVMLRGYQIGRIDPL
jgi:hypothetical protein